MNFQLNNNVSMGTATEEQQDFSWGEISTIKKDQFLLTEIGYSSEKDQYRDTALGVLSEDNETMDENYDPFKIFTEKPLNNENIAYFDKMINDGKITFDENGNPNQLMVDDNAVLWNRLKNKGYTPDSFAALVHNNTNVKYMDAQKKMSKFDLNNSDMASMTANAWGTIKAVAHDPLVWAEIGLENFVFKGAKVGSTVRKSKKAIIDSLPRLQKVAKQIDEMMDINPTGAQELRKKLNNMVDIVSKNAKKAVDKFGSGAVEEATAFQRMLEKQGLDADDVLAKMITQAKSKKDPFKDPNTAKMILEMTKGDKAKDIAMYGGLSGAVAGFSEWVRQEGSYDFKHSVLPEYTEKDKQEAIAINAGAGMVAGFAFEVIAPLWTRWKNKDVSGWTLTDGDSGEQLIKGNKNLADDTLDSEIKPTFDEEVDLMGSGPKPEVEIEANIKHSEENINFKETTDKYNYKQNELDLIQKCINGGA